MVEEETECRGAIIPTTTPKPLRIDCEKCGNKLILTEDERYYCNYCKLFFDEK